MGGLLTARTPKAAKPAAAPAAEAPAEGVTGDVIVADAPPVEAAPDTPPLAFDLTAVVVRAVSSRAPYTRGGIHFASRREGVVLPETTTPDQTRRLIADTAITLSLVHLESGQSAELPRDLFNDEGEPDFERLTALGEDLASRVTASEAAA